MLAHAPFSAAKASDPVRIIASVREQHCSRLQATQEFFCGAIVMGLTSRMIGPLW
jgi:hypothetical protein